MSEVALSARFVRGVERANEWHAGHVRKGTSIPYMAHLLAVAGLVLEAEGDEDLAIAAMLHDAVEDRPKLASLEAIEREFGARVAKVVRSCMDTLEEGDRGPESWRARKESYRAHLRTAHRDALLVSCADKLHNASSLLRDLRQRGPEVWTRFNNPDPQAQLWYYRSLAEVFLERLEKPRWLPEELDRVVGEIETEVS